MLEAVHRYFGPCWHDCITHAHPWWKSHVQSHIQSCFIGFLRLLLRSGVEAICDVCVILLDAATGRLVQGGHKGMGIVGNNTYLAELVPRHSKHAEKMSPRASHQHHQPEPLIQGGMNPCFHAVYTEFWPFHLHISVEIHTRQCCSMDIFSFSHILWKP